MQKKLGWFPTAPGGLCGFLRSKSRDGKQGDHNLRAPTGATKIKNTVEALARLNLTKFVLSLVSLVANAFICHRKVRGYVDVVLQVNLVIEIAESLQSSF